MPFGRGDVERAHSIQRHSCRYVRAVNDSRPAFGRGVRCGLAHGEESAGPELPPGADQLARMERAM